MNLHTCGITQDDDDDDYDDNDDSDYDAFAMLLCNLGPTSECAHM